MSDWRGYQLLNVACAMNNGTQCRQKVKTRRDVVVSQFSFYRLLCCPCALGHDRLLYMGTGANPQQTGIPYREACGVERHLSIVGYFA